jgi:hypothetical protein
VLVANQGYTQGREKVAIRLGKFVALCAVSTDAVKRSELCKCCTKEQDAKSNNNISIN